MRCYSCLLGKHKECKEPCYCFAEDWVHRFVLGMEDDGFEADSAKDAGDGGLGSRTVVDRWEWEKERSLAKED